MAVSSAVKFVGLPLSVAQPADIGRLLREVERIDETLRQAAIRSPQAAVLAPELSLQLDEIIKLNSVDIMNPSDRAQLVRFLAAVKARAGIIHISFGAEPSKSFIDKLMTYLRREINPLTLIVIGLEPNIGAGCEVRTTNKYFDFSLKESLKKNRPMLTQQIRGEPVVAKQA